MPFGLLFLTLFSGWKILKFSYENPEIKLEKGQKSDTLLGRV
jgi:hypothetical protein